MNKAWIFLAALLSIFIIDLFYFEAPPSASQMNNGITSTNSLAGVNDGDVDYKYGFDVKLVSNSQNNGDPASMNPGTVFDPVTMLLLGSGLVGLAGLGRKKI